jgi:hypothetical protein
MATKAKDRPAATPPRTRYKDDLYTWVQEQVALLRAGRLDEIDALNVAEELADVGRSEYRALESAITVLLLHLLKWDYQPKRRSRSWELSVRVQRARVTDELADNPGLKSRLFEAIERGHKYARIGALEETRLPDEAIPEACTYGFDELMTREIVYESPASRKSRKR